jgi:hypothetical protein
MFDSPLMTTPFAVVQVLRDFASKLGIDATYAEVLAQIHLQQNANLDNWGKFLMSECRCCKSTPTKCAFLHPTERQCRETDETPTQLSSANRAGITYGRIKICPFFKGERIPIGSQK